MQLPEVNTGSKEDDDDDPHPHPSWIIAGI